MNGRNYSRDGAALGRLALYALVVLAPLIIVAVLRPKTTR